MKKLSVLSLGLCAVLALASCGTSKESAYKKAYEKAQQQEAQQEAPAAQEPVVTPLETTQLLQRAQLQRLIMLLYVRRMLISSQVLVCRTTA